MPLLALKNLTVRFGGLTAVSGVDCALEEHQIVSVIGPNGAGKTTVFNAVTGIYEPSQGSIEFAGRELIRPFNSRVAATALAIGLLTALAAFLSAVNVDRLWQASIKRNYAGPGQSFSYAAAWRGAADFLAGRVQASSQRGGRWAVTSADGRRTLLYADSQQAAEESRDQLNALETILLNREPMLERREEPDGSVTILQGDDYAEPATGMLAKFPSVTAADLGLASLQAIGKESVARRRNGTLAALFGLLLGVAGTGVVWSRARRGPEFVARSGIARTFQNIRLFQNMTVLENVLSGMDRQFRAGVFRMALRTPAVRREEAQARAKATAWLELVGMTARAGELAKNLSYGEQRRLEIARALATEPRVLLLDEPAAGMNPAESAELGKLVQAIRGRGLSVLLIEHHMRVVMGISDRIAVLEYGRKIAEGTPAEVRVNPAVIKAYLGDEEVG